MRVRPKLALVITAVITAPFVGVISAPAELPVTIPTDATAESGAPALLDVAITNTGSADEVTFTYAGESLPGVDATAKSPPFYNTAGDTLTVPGTSFVNVRMFPARGASFGESCSNAIGAPPTPGPGETAVDVFFSCVDGLNGPAPVVPSGRAVPSGSPDAVLAATFDALLAGPTASDTTAGLSSPFSAATAGLFLSAAIAPDGIATIDFDASLATTIPNASSSAGSDQLLRQLDATVFQFPGITAATYTLGGSCDDFFAWLQMSCSPRVPNDGAAAQFAITYTGPDIVTGPSENVTQAVLIEDFEAQVTWVIGLRDQTDVTVTTASNPARVVVRVPHFTPTAQPRFTG
jgi:hypothetical protein